MKVLPIVYIDAPDLDNKPFRLGTILSPQPCTTFKLEEAAQLRKAYFK